MKTDNLNSFIKGWVVGNFVPSIVKTEQFELGLKKYESGIVEKKHYHKIAKEITIAISGKFEMNGKILEEGDILVLDPGEPAEFRCLESGYTAVLKIPSVKNDKYILD